MSRIRDLINRAIRENKQHDQLLERSHAGTVGDRARVYALRDQQRVAVGLGQNTPERAIAIIMSPIDRVTGRSNLEQLRGFRNAELGVLSGIWRNWKQEQLEEQRERAEQHATPAPAPLLATPAPATPAPAPPGGASWFRLQQLRAERRRIEEERLRLQRAMQQADERLAVHPAVQTPGLRGALARIIAQRNNLLWQLQMGRIQAADARMQIMSLMTTGEGSAVGVQAPEVASEWQQQAAEATGKAAEAQQTEAAIVAATPAVPSGRRGILLGAAIGAVVGALGYEESRLTGGGAGAAVGGLIAVVVKKIRDWRAAA